MADSCRRCNRRLQRRLGKVALATSAALAASAARPDSVAASLEEVIVTAQKRAENLQNVPISVQALDAKDLADLHVDGFSGYSRYLTSLSTQDFGPGQAQLYFRGVTNGGDGLHVGPQPLVGVYLDEMPVTTIYNNLDVHIYDIARIEALAGPQGTLFGASSMAGTLRIISNQPDTDSLRGGYDVTGRSFGKGDTGGTIEGFVNVPLSNSVAIRLVGFAERDVGYVDNVLGPDERYPTSGEPRTNTGLTRRNFNPVDSTGGRAALRVGLTDDWTVTSSIHAQRAEQEGVAWFAPALGDLRTARYAPEYDRDRWWLATLTVEGKVGDLDLLYAGGYLQRSIDDALDYSDYTYSYDVAYAQTAYPTYFGDNFRDNQGNLISPAETMVGRDRFTKQSHELRLTTPVNWHLRGVAGVFLQRQVDDTRNEYRVDGLADQYSISNLPGVLYLNSMSRTDRDRALFADASYDVAPRTVLTAGVRRFSFDNSVYGFFGFNGQQTYDGYVRASGEVTCAPGTQTTSTLRPCVNVDSRAARSGTTHRVNLTYAPDAGRLLYATWSTGFRPGGVNRVRARPDYAPDYLTNVEAGWKTEWLQRRLRFNGALFLEKWKDAQFGILGANGITEILNAGRAEIRGVELELAWRASDALTLSGSMTALDAKMQTNVCRYASASLTCTEPQVIYNADGSVAQTLSNAVLAPSGSRLPVSPHMKGSLVARYESSFGDFRAHAQGALVAQSNVIPQLQVDFARALGTQPGYATVDLSAGLGRGRWTAEVFVQNAFDRRGELVRTAACAPTICTLTYVVPITARLFGMTLGQHF